MNVRFALCAFAALVCSAFSTNVSRAAEAPRPNILFIIFDDWSGNHAGAYGCKWINTPGFDRVAKEGVLFRNAFTSNPKCSPCRASILTGRNSWQLEEAVGHGGLFPSKFAVYPDLLEGSGYQVGLTGKGWGPGDFKVGGRTRNPAGPSFDAHKQQPPASGMGQLDYPKNFETFLAERDEKKPFCFWMGFQEPHRAYEPRSGVRLGKKLEDIQVPAYLPDCELVRHDLADYAVEVEYADAQIVRTLEILDKAKLAENTLVIITSDHGMPFPYVKGQIHEDGFHLPMAARWPAAIKAGRVVNDFINVRDLAPTYLELAGIEPHKQMTGKSLVNILRAEQSGWIEDRHEMLVGKERHDIGRPNDLGYPVRALRTKEFLYVHNFHPDRWPAGNPETDFGNCDPSPSKELLKYLGGHFYDLSFGKRAAEELYDLSRDPECVNNLAEDVVHRAKAEELRNRMLELLTADEDPRVLGKAEIFDTYKYLGGRKKGYETWLAEKLKEAPDFLEVKPANEKRRAAARGEK